MEMKYKVRAALTILLFAGGPIFYGLADKSKDALFTFAAMASIPYMIGWIMLLSLSGTGIERGIKFLLKKYNKGAG